MDILLIGGPRFLGLAVIEAALAAGHRVTTFNRGRTNPDAFPAVEKLHGNRDGELAALAGRRWDAVIDTSGYVPRVVGQSALLLRDAVERYLFVSTISVYREPLAPNATEDAPVVELADPAVEEITGETYGGLKVLCERMVQEIYGPRALIVRPGLIVGPHDPSNRFTYWVTRTAAGGEVLAPNPPDAPVQIIDVRDLGAWMVRLVEAGTSGVFNATGPAARLTFGAMLEACRQVADPGAQFTWVDSQFLLDQEVAPWTEIPLWLPGGETLDEVNIDRALAAGLTFRPLAATIADTLAWARTTPAAQPPPAGLARAREDELLDLWRKAQSGAAATH